MGRAKLQPGEDTIKSVTPRKTETGYELRWRVRDFEGRLYAKRTQARTVGEARRRAFEKAEQIKRATSETTAWTTADSITDFIDREVEPVIKEKRLSKASRARYLEVMAHYRRYTQGKSISAATSASSLIRTLKTISKEIGPETARQTRSVVSNYLFGQLIVHQLTPSNPIRGMSFDFLKSENSEGKYYPTQAEWQAFLDYVLADDPDSPMPGKENVPQAHKREAKARHARIIQLTELQLATGLRASEARQITWADVTQDDHGVVWVTVRPEISKTKVGRTIPVLVPEVGKRLLARKGKDEELVIPQPNSGKPWDKAGVHKAVRDYYEGVAGTSEDLAFLKKIRSHAWRGALNTITAPHLRPDIRAAYFGHTEKVNARAYTDHVNVRPMMEAVEALTQRE
ncbi:site-specific recombinase, phage integrase family [Actinomyces sp. ICM54]|uniref:tyrosine-type recombinase/integrase n=1 Tax=Actinomyces sp. ICM54 TaxID=936549 RepID=UPI000452FF79|nr:tyrosine-type recombinase/integrase [Actinomyces sp. ICM54]EWC96335.1 site-specific recombinase, phage integrase family [Actinomyces sp. ICM54]